MDLRVAGLTRTEDDESEAVARPGSRTPDED